MAKNLNQTGIMKLLLVNSKIIRKQQHKIHANKTQNVDFYIERTEKIKSDNKRCVKHTNTNKERKQVIHYRKIGKTKKNYQ